LIATLVCGRLLTHPKEHESKTGNFLVKARLKAMLGREASETWELLAYSPAAREAILTLGLGAHLAVTGVPKTEITMRQDETVISRTLFVDRVLSLLPQEEGSTDE